MLTPAVATRAMIRMKRFLIGLIAVGLLATIASIAGYEGPLMPVNPDISITIPGSGHWVGPPAVVARTADPDGVYVVVPAMPVGEEFAAIRVSSTTGRQTSVNIQLGPSSGTRGCLPSDQVRAMVHGVRFARPGIYLWRFPGGGGPGFEYTDSATGRIDIVFDRPGRTRTLLTRRAYNSDRIVEMLAMISLDPGAHWIAVPLRGHPDWTLSIFRLH
jgi:hypothetical protein